MLRYLTEEAMAKQAQREREDIGMGARAPSERVRTPSKILSLLNLLSSQRGLDQLNWWKRGLETFEINSSEG